MADLDRTGDLEVKVVGTNGITAASVTSTHRLQVTAQLEAGGTNPVFTLQPFVPVVNYDSSGTSIDSATFTSFLSVTGTEGKLDFIACAGLTSNYRIRVTIDGTQIYDIAMSDLNAIGLANATNVELWAETANKNFRYRPNIPVDFTTSLLVEGKATGATLTLYYLIAHREAT